ncbi:hypothetical protein QQP08_020461 [Theobroma cacao]|nr:hypothetical protein QQP08_020461 [Theobroma cacao]
MNCCALYTSNQENPSTSYNPSSKSRRLRTLIRSLLFFLITGGCLGLNPSISGVLLHCDKCRTKAMRIAAVADAWWREQEKTKDQVAMTGEGIDSAYLTCLLRKKLGYATIISVGEAKGPEKKSRNSLHEVVDSVHSVPYIIKWFMIQIQLSVPSCDGLFMMNALHVMVNVSGSFLSGLIQLSLVLIIHCKSQGNLKGEIPNVHEASTQAARRMDKSLSHDEMTT